MNVQNKVISREISEYLWRAGKTVSTAESCSAGLVSSSIAALPGASTYFRGGVVVYTNELKTQLLGVSGAIEQLHTDYAVAVTGYAGPGGGPEAKVGTIFVAAGKKGTVEVRMLSGDHGREENVARACLVALQILLETLKNDFPLTEE